MTPDEVEKCVHAYNFLLCVTPSVPGDFRIGIARDLIWNLLCEAGCSIWEDGTTGKIMVRPAGGQQKPRNLIPSLVATFAQSGMTPEVTAPLLNDEECRRFLTACALHRLNINT